MNTESIGKSRGSVIHFFPVLFIVGIVPLIVKGKYFILNGIEKVYWKGCYHFDIFTYYKALCFIIAVLILGIIFTFLKVKNKILIKRIKYNKFILSYAFLIVLSSLFSENILISIRGYTDTYQGMIVLLCYLFLVFVVYNMVNDEKEIRIIFKTLIISSLIVAVIGILQHLGYDIFLSENFINFYQPKNFNLTPEDMSYITEGNSYSTMYVSNYLGNYVILVFPIIIPMILYGKNKKTRIFYIFALIISLVLLLYSESRAGYLSMFLILIVLTVFFRRQLLEYKKFTLIGIVIILLIILGLNFKTNGEIFKEMSRLNIFEENERMEEASKRFKIIDIVLENNKCKVVTSENAFSLDFSDGIKFYNKKNISVELIKENNTIKVNDEAFNKYKIVETKFEQYTDYILYRGGTILIIFKNINGKIYIESGCNKLIDTVPKIESFGFRDWGRFASNRGYIWSRSIPLLKNTILLGYGPDNFIINYPQDDIVGKFNNMNTYKIIVTKPHNMFLQIGVNTGVLSLLIYLVFIFMYIRECFKLYFKRSSHTFLTTSGVCICACVIGYLAAGIFNDSLIYSAPIYWTLLGIGISVNYKMKIEKDVEDKQLKYID